MLADWYAVHVLLHPAPLFMRFWPFKKHSDLIIRNRPKLEQNIVCMVQDDLLAPDKIWGHLERYEVFGRLLAGAHDPKMIARLVDFVQSNALLVPLAEQVDRPDIAAWLDQLLHEHLGKASIGKPLGQWLLKAMARGEQQAAWESIHNGLTSNINSQQSIDLISKVVRSALLGYLPTFRIQAKRPEVRKRLEKWLRSWLEGLHLARLAGTAVRDAIHKGAYNAFLDDLLGHLHNWVSEDAAVRAVVRKMLEDAIASYKREINAIQRWFATFLRGGRAG